MKIINKKIINNNFFYIILLIILGFFAIRKIFPNFNNYIVGDGGDASIFVWDLWWVKYSIIHLHQSPYYTDFLLYPKGVSLVTHTLAIVNGIISIPLQIFFRLNIAHNILFIINLLLCLISTYYLALKFNINRIGAVIASIIFSLSPGFFAQTQGHFNITTLWFMPLGLLFFINFLDTNKFKWIFWSSFILALSIYNDFYIGFYLLIIYIIFFIGYSFFKKNNYSIIFFKKVLLFISILVILLAPLMIISIKNIRSNEFLPKSNLSDYNYYRTDIIRFITPPYFNPYVGYWHNKINTNSTSGLEEVSYLGFTPILLLIFAVIFLLKDHKSTKKHLLIISLIALLLFLWTSLGPIVHFNGQGIKFFKGLPYLVIMKIPILNNLRVCARFVIPSMLFLGILNGYTITKFSEYLNKSTITKYIMFVINILIIILIMLEYSAKIQMYDSRLSNIYQIIAKDDNNVQVLNIPLEINSGRTGGVGKGFSKQQLTQSIHNKKMLGGSISYFSDSEKKIYQNYPGISWIINPENDQSENDKDSVLVKNTFKNLGIKYIVLSKKDSNLGLWFSFDEKTLIRIQDYLTEIVGAKEIASDGINILYTLPYIN